MNRNRLNVSHGGQESIVAPNGNVVAVADGNGCWWLWNNSGPNARLSTRDVIDLLSTPAAPRRALMVAIDVTGMTDQEVEVVGARCADAAPARDVWATPDMVVDYSMAATVCALNVGLGL